jgi:hypothetical protein
LVYSEGWGAFLKPISISFGGSWPIFRVQEYEGTGELLYPKRKEIGPKDTRTYLFL